MQSYDVSNDCLALYSIQIDVVEAQKFVVVLVYGGTDVVPQLVQGLD